MAGRRLGWFASVVVVLFAAGTGCRSPAQPPPASRRVVGVIDVGSGPAPLQLPDTVSVGVPFEVTMTVFGGACDTPDGADVQTRGLFADITPYELPPAPGTVCIALLRSFARAANVTFDTVGLGIVRVHGRGPHGNETVQGTVVVRP